MSQLNNVTSGQVYHTVIANERSGDYLGGTIQVIPHVTNEIKKRVLACAEGLDLLVVEVGGTVGDIESLPFLEAIRQLRLELGTENSISVHVTLLPYLSAAGELKTKPTQHSVQKMREIGIQADVLVCRSEHEIEESILQKIAMFCSVSRDAVFVSADVDTIYALPLMLADQGMDNKLSEMLNIWSRAARLTPWEDLVDTVRNPKHTVTIAMVGKYVSLVESYKSINEALTHGGVSHHCAVNIIHVDAADIEEKGASAMLSQVDAILVAPGFGSRGTEGKIAAVQFAREQKIPFFGICLGMQMAVIEFARNVCGLEGAASTEMREDAIHPVVDLMPDQQGITDKGATMRLGAYPCKLKEGSLVRKIYAAVEIQERHRHRWEVNNEYREKLEAKGLILSGVSPDDRLVEIVEVKNHPFYVACQFHPEFKSRPLDPHPLFVHFVSAALEMQKRRTDGAGKIASKGNVSVTIPN